MVTEPKLSRREFVVRTSLLAAAAGLGAEACASSDAADDANAGDAASDADGTADAASDGDGARDAAGDAAHGDDAADAAPGADAAATGIVTLSMVHVNDLHANYNPDRQGSSPVSRIAGYRRKVAATNPHTIFTNAGDDFEKGSVAELMSSGQVNMEITKRLGFDVRCIGNHDFAWDIETVLAFSDDPVGDTLLSNVSYTGAAPERWRAKVAAVREVGGVRLGYFGMVGKPWNEFNEQYDGDFYPEFPMRHDYVARAAEVVAELRDQVDVVVMLSHLGLGLDREIAAAVSGIDVVLGGHSHSVVTPEERVNGTLIVQAGSSAAFIAHLDIDVDVATRRITAHRYQLVPNAAALAPPDADTERDVREILSRLAPGATEAVGETSATKSEEATTALLAAAAAAQLGADAAVADVSTCWAPLPAGPVTPQHFVDAFKVERQPAGTPGFNSFGVGTVTGAVLRQIATSMPEGWGYSGPAVDAIDDGATYRLAAQRNVAGRMEASFGAGASIASFTLADECWSILTGWARARAAAGQTID